MQTLTDIESNTTTLPPPDNEAISKITREIIKALPFETPTLREFSSTLNKGFMKGYDDVYRRVDYASILKATKLVSGQLVPSFAIYDVNESGECSVNYLVDGLYQIQYANRSTKIKHYTWHVMKWASMLAFGGLMLTAIVDSIMNYNSTTAGLRLVLELFGIVLSCAFMSYFMSNKPKIVITMSHKFKGAVPDEIRNLIRELQPRSNMSQSSIEKYGTCGPDKFEKILMVEESYDWVIDEIQVNQVRNVDPLLIGKKFGVYFLIKKYDVIPLENIFAQEFTA